MEELAKHGTYVAGFLDASVQGRTDLYDLFVNGEGLCVSFASPFTYIRRCLKFPLITMIISHFS